MRFKPVLLLILFALITGLSVGILDSILHRTGYDDLRIFNIMVFVMFFIGIYWFSSFYRNAICNGFIGFRKAFGVTLLIGTVASMAIAGIRYIYLRYVIEIDVAKIVEETRNNMIQHYELYPQELIENRLQFIEFSYQPLVSSLLYFAYYSLFAIVFSIIISFFIKRIDRDISII